MRGYNDKEKSLLKKIASCISTEQNRFGDEIKEMFDKSSLALLVLRDECEGCIFTYYLDEKSKAKALSEVVWYLSFLQHCEQQNLIYCMEDNSYTGLLFYSKYNSDVAIETIGRRYSYTNGTIVTEDSEFKLKDKSGNTIMYGFRCPESLTVLLKHFFTAKLFPTSILLELQSEDFQTVEERSLTKQLKEAKRNFKIAIAGLALSLLMPPLSIFISNKYGYTTIEGSQYIEITRKIDSIVKVLNSNQKSERDTIKIKETVTHSILK